MSQSVNCRPATLDDYERITALENRYGLGHRNYDVWSHGWANNPVYKRVPHLEIGWVLENSRNEIVGSMGSVPFGFELNGQQLIAGTGRAWVVDASYRRYALVPLEAFFSQAGVNLHLAVNLNSQSEPPIARRAKRVPVGVWNHAAFWVTNSWGFVGSALARKEVPLRAVVRYPAWTVMLIRQLVKRDVLRAALRTSNDYDVRRCASFDARFDDFWEKLRARSPHRLLFTRSREVLEWRFKQSLERNASWISTVSDSGRLIAYAVFCRQDVPRIGLRRVRLIDYQSLDGNELLLRPILAHEIERCRREGTAVLESIGWRLEPGDFMATLAPYFRTLPWQYFYKTSDPTLAAVLKRRDVWHPSHFEGSTGM